MSCTASGQAHQHRSSTFCACWWLARLAEVAFDFQGSRPGLGDRSAAAAASPSLFNAAPAKDEGTLRSDVREQRFEHNLGASLFVAEWFVNEDKVLPAGSIFENGVQR